MKRILKRILIIAMAVVCVCSVQLTVSAAPSIGEGLGGLFEDLINNMLTSLNPNNTTTQEDPNNTTTNNNPDNTTTDPNAPTTSPINNSGTGTLPSSTEPTQSNTNNYQPNTMPTQLTTAEPAGDEEESSFTYEGSLSDLLEEDTAAIIVQTPTENYTIGGLVVNNGGGNDGLQWQQIVLIAAAVLFVILAALVIALLVQRGKKSDDSYGGISTDSDTESDVPSGPVPVEVVTPERIAELLGAASGKQNGGGMSLDGLSSDDSAAAIKAAALMGQLGSYSDPLIRKYTEEPVRISPISQMNIDGDISAADILEATDSMLDDITGNERYASDTRGMDVFDTELDSILNDTKTKTCPECNAPVPTGDVFCHSCGAYVG